MLPPEPSPIPPLHIVRRYATSLCAAPTSPLLRHALTQTTYMATIPYDIYSSLSNSRLRIHTYLESITLKLSLYFPILGHL